MNEYSSRGLSDLACEMSIVGRRIEVKDTITGLIVRIEREKKSSMNCEEACV